MRMRRRPVCACDSSQPFSAAVGVELEATDLQSALAYGVTVYSTHCSGETFARASTARTHT